MIIACENNYLAQIYEYIGLDYWKCLYLYLNLEKYGLYNENIHVWSAIRDKELKAIIMQYYDCMHLFSRNSDYNTEEISSHIIQRRCNVVMSTGENIRKLTPYLEKDFNAEFFGIFKSPDQIKKHEFPEVEKADRSDIEKIVNFMLTDKSYTDLYSYDVLYKQLLDRFDTGYSRFYVIRDKEQIIASYSTYAETEQIAVLGGLLVDPNYRGQNLSLKLASVLSNELIQSGKSVYAIISNEASKRIHSKLEFSQIDESGKLTRKVLL